MEGIACGSGFALALLVGGHVDEVVLLQIIGGREQGLLHVGEVYVVHPVGTVHIAVHHHVASVSVDGEVAGLGQGIQDGEMVLGDCDDAGLFHFAHHLDAQVEILHGDDGVGDQLARDKAVFDVVCHFAPGHACHVYLPQNGKVDGSLFIHRVGYYLGIARTLSGCGLGRGFGTQDVAGVCGCGEGELLLQHGVAAVDHDVYLVLGPEAELALGLQGHVIEGFCILEIGNVLGCSTCA